MAEHPPVWRHPNKQVVFDIATDDGKSPPGRLSYSQWAAMPLPESTGLEAADGLVLARDGYFDYRPVFDHENGLEWHVNFADPHLFVAYGSSLFAQDEMQVAEHPVLGALREALVADGHDAVTVEHSEPTPVLVMGVQRRCRVSSDPNPAEGRPYGLYGNAFARATADTVARATTVSIHRPSPTSSRWRPRQVVMAATASTRSNSCSLRPSLGSVPPCSKHSGPVASAFGSLSIPATGAAAHSAATAFSWRSSRWSPLGWPGSIGSCSIQAIQAGEPRSKRR